MRKSTLPVISPQNYLRKTCPNMIYIIKYLSVNFFYGFSCLTSSHLVVETHRKHLMRCYPCRRQLSHAVSEGCAISVRPAASAAGTAGLHQPLREASFGEYAPRLQRQLWLSKRRRTARELQKTAVLYECGRMGRLSEPAHPPARRRGMIHVFNLLAQNGLRDRILAFLLFLISEVG